MSAPYYDEGGITIYHGDCREVLPDIDPLMVSLLVTDPPYGIRTDTAYARRGSASGRLHSPYHHCIDHPPVHGDKEPFDPALLLRFPRCVLFGANNYASRLPDSGSWIVWDRASGNSHTADAELAWTNLGGTVRTFRHKWNGVCRDSEIGYHVHPTQKPVALMRWIIERWSEPGDLILDPYMGSGPVAQAAHECGRRYIGVEVVEDYCAIAVSRVRQGALDFGGAA